MSIRSEITRIENAKSDIAEAIADKGVTVPSGTTLDGMAALISDIETGSDPVLQTKTVTPTTSKQTITADSGYDGLDTVTVNAMPTATQATPTVSIDSAGKITATATQAAGYVAAGTRTGTKQLNTQAAKTITPSTSSQTAVEKNVYTTGAVTVGAIPSTYVKPTTTKAATTYTPTTSNQTIAAGTYCSGAQTIKGDANLVAGNIKSGVSIFGVDGNYEGSGGSSSGGSLQAYHIDIVDTTSYGDLSGTANFTCLNEDGTIEVVTVERDILGWSAENVIVGSTAILKLSNQSDIPTGVEFSECTGDINISERQMCFTILSVNADSEWGSMIMLL